MRFWVRAFVCPAGIEVYNFYYLRISAKSKKQLHHIVDTWFHDHEWSIPMSGYFIIEGYKNTYQFSNQSFD